MPFSTPVTDVVLTTSAVASTVVIDDVGGLLDRADDDADDVGRGRGLADGEPSTQVLRHMTMRPPSSRVPAAMLVLVFLAGCSNAGGSSGSCEPGVSPCDDTNELQTFFPEVVPQS